MKNKLVILIILAIGVSCTKQIEINRQNLNQEYGINCLFSPDNPLELYVFKTSLITENTFQFIDDFDVELFENDSLLWSGSNSEAGKYSIPVQPKSNKEYKIIAKNDEGISISASDFVPAKVSIVSATNLYPVFTDNYETTYGRTKLIFNDQPYEKNYYEIVVLCGNNSVVHTLKVNSPVISYDIDHDPNPSGSLLFTDELFQGKQLTLEIYSDCEEPTIVLKNVSYNYYEYRRSITAHFYNQNSRRDDVYNLFKGDPLELYSNVSNGLGIFAAFSQDIKVCTKTDE